jgi:MFS superfamily sulfate permease-like transporter
MRAWIDMTLMNLTFFLTIIWSVQVGVTVSLIISLLLVVRRSSRTRMAILVGISFIKQDDCFAQMHRAR